MRTYHVKAKQVVHYEIAVKANTKTQAVEKLKAAYEDGEFDPFQQHHEEDNLYGDVMNYVRDGDEPTFEGDKNDGDIVPVNEASMAERVEKERKQLCAIIDRHTVAGIIAWYSQQHGASEKQIEVALASIVSELIHSNKPRNADEIPDISSEDESILLECYLPNYKKIKQNGQTDRSSQNV